MQSDQPRQRESSRDALELGLAAAAGLELLYFFGGRPERQCCENDVTDTVWIGVAEEVEKVIASAGLTRQRDQYL